jgi:alpha-mannosidase
LSIANDRGVGVRLSSEPGTPGGLELPGGALPLPRLDLLEDLSDTWSHDIDRYPEEVIAQPEWQPPQTLERGPLLHALQQGGTLATSAVTAEHRVYAGQPFVELRLRVHWTARHRILKLTFELPSPAVWRRDGIPSAPDQCELERALDGREHPVRDRTLLELADGRRLGLVFPDVFALDATPARVRLTMLRSPLMAHHDPYRGPAPRGTYADQGEHEFRFRILLDPAAMRVGRSNDSAGASAGSIAGPTGAERRLTGAAERRLTGADLDRHAFMLQRPLVTADLTRGMPAV